jgi:hypothetical protein
MAKTGREVRPYLIATTTQAFPYTFVTVLPTHTDL